MGLKAFYQEWQPKVVGFFSTLQWKNILFFLLFLIMAFIFRKEEKVKQEEQINFEAPPAKRPISHTMLLFFTLVLIMVFANWGAPESGDTSSVWFFIFSNKWYITGLLGLLLAYSLIKVLKIKWQWVILGVIATALSAFLTNRFISDNKMTPMVPMLVGVAALSIITLFDKNDEENKEWTLSAWGFTKQIMPLLAIGVVITGFLLGSTHDNVAIPGVVPNEWVEWAVGGNSLLSNFFASIAGAFMYFATLTEVPIVQGLLASGMGKGPALALLLAGPSVSLPNMLVIRGVMGTKKTVTYIALVVIMATLTGMVYGNFF